jgi:hypothetical protein
VSVNGEAETRLHIRSEDDDVRREGFPDGLGVPWQFARARNDSRWSEPCLRQTKCLGLVDRSCLTNVVPRAELAHPTISPQTSIVKSRCPTRDVQRLWRVEDR